MQLSDSSTKFYILGPTVSEEHSLNAMRYLEPGRDGTGRDAPSPHQCVPPTLKCIKFIQKYQFLLLKESLNWLLSHSSVQNLLSGLESDTCENHGI